ncbi:MAG: hypothetical protein WBA16_01370 [Nonlabens sp.]
MKAETEKPFGSDLFIDHEELHDIYQVLNVSNSQSAIFFCRKVHEIYNEFAALSHSDREAIQDVYVINNRIEEICIDNTAVPMDYQTLNDISMSLSSALKSFYSKLYGSESPFNLAAFGKLSDSAIHDFDKAFMTENDKEICPFCGISPLKGNNHRYREAYDHFLPKSLYPFNSVNFQNLAPMCNECNSTYKRAKDPSCDLDPVKKNQHRRKAFYPYSIRHPKLEIQVSLTSDDPFSMKPNNVDLEFVTNQENREEELESWDRIFGITERYKAVICSNNGGVEWFKDIYDEFANYTELTNDDNPDLYFSNIVKSARKYPLNSKGFLKVPFLEECKGKGLLEIR